MVALQSWRIAEIADQLCDLLRWHDECHPRLAAFLWDVILNTNVNMPTTMKAKLLSVFWDRLSNFATVNDAAIVRSNEAEITDTCMTGVEGRVDGPLGIASIAGIMTSFIIRRPSVSSHRSVYGWAITQALNVFAPTNPLENRWKHVTCLALFNRSISGNATLRHNRLDNSFGCDTDWSAIFTLSTLENTFQCCPSSPVRLQAAQYIGGMIRDLWQTWCVGADRRQTPPSITLTVLTSFVRLAGIATDVHLKDALVQYCSLHHLWPTDYRDRGAVLQAQCLGVEYIISSICCGIKNWATIFAGLGHIPSQLRSDIIAMALSRLIARDAEIAYQLYMYFRHDENVKIEGSIIHSLSASLASHNLFELAIPFLQDPRLSPHQVQALIHAIACSLRQKRCRHLESRLLAMLGGVMEKSYTHSPPSLVHRSSIQYAISVIALNGHAAMAGTILRVILKSSPSYITSKFFGYILRQIVKQRQFRLATHMLSVVPTSHLARWRLYLTLRLAKAGASNLARKLNGAVPRSRYRLSRIGALVFAVDFRLRFPPRPLALKVMPIVMKKPIDARSVQFALTILLRAKRFLAARRLLDWTLREVDSKTQTTLGNMILHATLMHPTRRNGRQMRKVLSTLKALVDKHDFVPDRVTANTMLKAMMRWADGIDCPKMRAMFDYMITMGYPAGNRLPGGELPFGTSGATLPDFKFLHLSSFLSFTKHVRPMYKMFIKAFYLRGDISAAKTVVGILQVEESKEKARREKMYTARLKGMRKGTSCRN